MTATAEDVFNWNAWYLQKRDGFLSAAKTWRSIAHTAQMEGDEDVVIMAHRNALENEALANDAELKAKEFGL